LTLVFKGSLAGEIHSSLKIGRYNKRKRRLVIDSLADLSSFLTSYERLASLKDAEFWRWRDEVIELMEFLSFSNEEEAIREGTKLGFSKREIKRFRKETEELTLPPP